MAAVALPWTAFVALLASACRRRTSLPPPTSVPRSLPNPGRSACWYPGGPSRGNGLRRWVRGWRLGGALPLFFSNDWLVQCPVAHSFCSHHHTHTQHPDPWNLMCLLLLGLLGYASALVGVGRVARMIGVSLVSVPCSVGRPFPQRSETSSHQCMMGGGASTTDALGRAPCPAPACCPACKPGVPGLGGMSAALSCSRLSCLDGTSHSTPPIHPHSRAPKTNAACYLLFGRTVVPGGAAWAVIVLWLGVQVGVVGCARACARQGVPALDHPSHTTQPHTHPHTPRPAAPSSPASACTRSWAS